MDNPEIRISRAPVAQTVYMSCKRRAQSVHAFPRCGPEIEVLTWSPRVCSGIVHRGLVRKIQHSRDEYDRPDSPSSLNDLQRIHRLFRKCSSILSLPGVINPLAFSGDISVLSTPSARILLGISSYQPLTSAPTRLNIRSSGGIRTLEI